jgi:hypothetical protein
MEEEEDMEEVMEEVVEGALGPRDQKKYHLMAEENTLKDPPQNDTDPNHIINIIKDIWGYLSCLGERRKRE